MQKLLQCAKIGAGSAGVGSGGDFVLWLSYLSCSRNHGGIVYFWSERAQPLLMAVVSSSGQHGAACASRSMVGSLDINNGCAAASLKPMEQRTTGNYHKWPTEILVFTPCARAESAHFRWVNPPRKSPSPVALMAKRQVLGSPPTKCPLATQLHTHVTLEPLFSKSI